MADVSQILLRALLLCFDCVLSAEMPMFCRLFFFEVYLGRIRGPQFELEFLQVASQLKFEAFRHLLSCHYFNIRLFS
jgi:hypothetical protein